MIYFCLSNEGDLYNLGDHGDWESADCCAQDMQLHPVWTINEDTARNWSEFIAQELATTTSTGA
jgi:hypothetical protein